jgi:flavin-dependent dehydrogenase
MNSRPVEIVGGGLAGLSLGTALARIGVPTTVFEAGTYPRHRVCGEFIAGLDDTTTETLRLAPLLDGAKTRRTVGWYFGDRRSGGHVLGRPALAISRFTLDQRLAAAFVAAGGVLQTNRRCELDARVEGRVFATGRRPRRSDLLGMKMHVRGLAMTADLELHLGRSSYVGLSDVADGETNLCGLFHRQFVDGRDAGPEILVQTLRRCGLLALADRIRSAGCDAGSFTTVAGLYFGPETAEPGVLRLGDCGTAAPPFAGHGMALAFQSAARALAPLAAWSRGAFSWETAVAAAQRMIRADSARGLRTARFFHPWLLSRRRQWFFSIAQRTRMLPVGLMSRMLHN